MSYSMVRSECDVSAVTARKLEINDTTLFEAWYGTCGAEWAVGTFAYQVIFFAIDFAVHVVKCFPPQRSPCESKTDQFTNTLALLTVALEFGIHQNLQAQIVSCQFDTLMMRK